jgi:hypothetical protein
MKATGNKSEWSLSNTFKRVFLYLICFILIACGILILTTGGWFLAIPMFMLCGYYIYTDLRLLKIKPVSANKEELTNFVQLRDHIIKYSDKQGSDILVDLRQVVIIGEFTEERGLAGEWNLIFFRPEGGTVISMYVNGAEQLISDLGNYLGATIKPELGNKFKRKSRILWPKSDEGKPIWVRKNLFNVDNIFSEHIIEKVKSQN